LTNQGSQRKKVICRKPKSLLKILLINKFTIKVEELMSAVNSSSYPTMKLYPKMVSQSIKRPSEVSKKKKKGPKLTPELEQDQRALVKAKPKRKKVIGEKIIARSTAGNTEQSPDDDGIW